MPARVDGGCGLKPLDQMRERRRQMAHRRRRIIFNNDGDEISFEGVNTREKLLGLPAIAARRERCASGGEADALPSAVTSNQRRCGAHPCVRRRGFSCAYAGWRTA